MRFGKRLRALVAPLSVRLGGVAALLVGLMIAVGLVGVASIAGVESASREMSRNVAVPLEDLGLASAAVSENRTLLTRVLLVTDPTDDAASRARMRSNDQLIEIRLRRVEATLLTASGRTALAQLRRDLDRYDTARADVLALSDAGVDPLRVFAFNRQRALPVFDRIVVGFRTLFDSKVALADSRQRAITSIQDHGQSLQIGLLVAAVVIGVVASILIGRNIIGGLRTIQRAATRFGAGDLSPVAVGGSGEIGQLAESFNVMARSLSIARSALHEQHALVAAVLTSSHDYAIIATDLDGTITVFNTGAELMLGYRSEEALGLLDGRSLFESIGAEDARSRVAGLVPRTEGPAAAGCSRAVAEGSASGEVIVSRKDGTKLPVRLTVSALHKDSGETSGQLGIAVDLTSQRRLDRERRRTRVALERSATRDALTGLRNRSAVTTELTSRLADGVGAGLGLLLLDLDHFKRVNDTFGHAAGDVVLRAAAERIARTMRRSDIAGRWGGEEFVVIVSDVLTDGGLTAAAERVRAAIAGGTVTLADGSDVTVTASVGGVRAAPGATVERLLDDADRALYYAKRRGRDQVRLLQEAPGDLASEADTDVLRLAESLSIVTSLREGAPELHTTQVADLATRIAHQLDLPASVVLRCHLGGLLHDLGKVAIPDSILGKPGPLDADEWAVMRRHPEIGDGLAERIPGLTEARSAIRFHHERFDGTGYPDGLVGTAIPIEARIVAAADAFSAITSDRVYQRGCGRRDALFELRAGAGTQFDPDVVEAIEVVLSDSAVPWVGHSGVVESADAA